MHHSEIIIALSGKDLPKFTGLEYLLDKLASASGRQDLGLGEVISKIRYLRELSFIQGAESHYALSPRWNNLGDGEKNKWLSREYVYHRVVLPQSLEGSDYAYMLICHASYPYFVGVLEAIKEAVRRWVAESHAGRLAVEELDGTFSLVDIESYGDGFLTDLLHREGVIDLCIDKVPLAWASADYSLL